MNTTKRTREYYRGYQIYQFGRTWYAQNDDTVLTVQATSKRLLLKKLDEKHQAFLKVNGVHT